LNPPGRKRSIAADRLSISKELTMAHDAQGHSEPALRPEIFLDQFDERLDACRDPLAVAEAVLDAAMALHGAQFGTLRLLDKNERDLIVVAHRGFSADFLWSTGVVSARDDCACGQALRGRESILIPDVTLDDGYAPFRLLAAREGYRSEQATPMIAADGRAFGVLSTFFAEPHLPTQLELSMGRLFGAVAADLLRQRAGYASIAPALPLAQEREAADRRAHLALADSHIADATRRVLHQQEIVDGLRRQNLPVNEAEALLRTVVRTLELMLWRRRTIKRGPFGD
jgi:GAF domain-containing protein